MTYSNGEDRNPQVRASEDQIRMIVSLSAKAGLPVDPDHLAGLSKWTASREINALQGNQVAEDELVEDVMARIHASQEQAVHARSVEK